MACPGTQIMLPIESVVSGETAHEGNGMDATRRTVGFPQLQAPYKVMEPAGSRGEMGQENVLSIW